MKNKIQATITSLIFLGITMQLTIIYSGSILAAERVADQSASIKEISDTTTTSKKLKTAVIGKILSSHKSPLTPHADTFVITAEKYDLDAYFLPAIAWLESSLGKRAPDNSFNPFGWGGSNLVSWQNYDQGIETVAKALRMKYYKKGAKTIHDIGRIYSTSSTWSVRVDKLMSLFYNEEAKINKINFFL